MTEHTTTVVAESTMVLSGISKNYDGVAALTDVSLDIRPGEVHALLGENGAGKSTLMGVASGTTAPDTGTITVRGQLVDRLTPGEATRLGIAIVHQHPAVLPDMTVAENIRVAVPAEFLGKGDEQATTMRAMLDDVGSSAHLDDRVGLLSVAQRHLLELAKALVVSPSLLILDEPTAPLGPESVDLLFERVRRAASHGTAVVYITHRLAEVRELAQRVTVLRDGKLRGSSTVDSITDDELLALIVGRQLESTFPPKHEAAEVDDHLLTVSNLDGHGFTDVSFSARRGEIIGVSGIVGNGQSALLRALAGLEPFTGSVTIGSTDHTSKDLRRYSAYLPADRHSEGLMMTLSVRENAAISALKKFKSGLFLSRRKENEGVDRELSSLAVKTASPETVVSALSGGNQQKVVLARALLSEPAILVADEPTQGVDVGARAEIYRILREVSSDGVPVVVASSDAKELEGLCDRVLVMSRGTVVDVFEGDDVTEERLIHSAVRATTHTKQTATSTADRRYHPGRSLPAGRLRPGAHPRAGDAGPRRLRLRAQLALPVGVQHHLGHDVVRRARLHRAGPDDRAAHRRHRPLGGAAGRIPRRGRVVLPQRRQGRARHAARARRHGARRGGHRRDQRQPDQVRQVHPGRRDPGGVHRAAGPELPAARRARRHHRVRR